MPKNDLSAQTEEFKSIIAHMEANMEAHLRATFVKAKLCRGYYLQLVKEGFTEKEALELCKSFSMEM